jgi:hypothetical protein
MNSAPRPHAARLDCARLNRILITQAIADPEAPNGTDPLTVRGRAPDRLA